MDTFPLNAWYACAYDVEVKNELLARTVCKHSWCCTANSTHGGDPRRRLLAPPAATVEGPAERRRGDVRLPRLGLQRRRPLHPHAVAGDINPSACVRSFPVVEKHRFVWVWPGEAALADPALVPDMHWNDDPAWAGDGKMIRVNCDYRLVLDNLMDLTHEAFVHGSSIGQAALAEAPFVATHGDRTATVTRWMESIEAPPSGPVRFAVASAMKAR